MLLNKPTSIQQCKDVADYITSLQRTDLYETVPYAPLTVVKAFSLVYHSLPMYSDPFMVDRQLLVRYNGFLVHCVYKQVMETMKLQSNHI